MTKINKNVISIILIIISAVLLFLVCITYDPIIGYICLMSYIPGLIYFFNALKKSIIEKKYILFYVIAFIYIISLPFFAWYGFSTYKIIIVNNTNEVISNVHLDGASIKSLENINPHSFIFVISTFKDDEGLYISYMVKGKTIEKTIFGLISGGGQNKVLIVKDE